MSKLSLIALVGLCVVLTACGSAYALEYTYNATSGIYNVTAGTSEVYYNAAQMNYTLFPRYLLYNETNETYIKLLDIDMQTQNESELKNILIVCDETIQHGKDLLNSVDWSNSDLFVWPNNDLLLPAITTCAEFIKINEVTHELVKVRGISESMLEDMNASGYRKMTDDDPGLLYYDTGAYSLISGIIEGHQKQQIASACRKAHGIKVEPGKYESTKYTVPLGNYTATFELRTIDDQHVDNFAIFVTNELYTDHSGSGKEYHTENRNLTTFEIAGRKSRTNYLTICISEYFEPTKNKRTTPYSGYLVASDEYDSRPIQIDSREGVLQDHEATEYGATYQVDANTFAYIHTNELDYNKDVSLLIETFHIDKK